jgi:hypothetical protein
MVVLVFNFFECNKFQYTYFCAECTLDAREDADDVGYANNQTVDD